MKYYIYRINAQPVEDDQFYTMGTRSYTNANHAAGLQPTGISDIMCDSTADLYGSPDGDPLSTVDAYVSYGGRLYKVLNTGDPTVRPWIADKQTTPVICVTRRQLPEIENVNNIPKKLYDEVGYVYDIGSEGTVERYARYLTSSGGALFGFSGTGIAASKTNNAIDRKSVYGLFGTPAVVSTSTVRPSVNSSSLRSYEDISCDQSSYTAAASRYCVPRVTDNLPDTVERLEITDNDDFTQNVLKNASGEWSYYYTRTGSQGTEIKTPQAYARWWLRKSVYKLR